QPSDLNPTTRTNGRPYLSLLRDWHNTERNKEERERERERAKKRTSSLWEKGGCSVPGNPITPSSPPSVLLLKFSGKEKKEKGIFREKPRNPENLLTFSDWVLVFLISGCSRFYFVFFFFFWVVGGWASEWGLISCWV
ncbi:hypothetical protein TorRG33x02_230090, partial [Trema orientale]